LLFEGAAVWERSNRNALAPDLALQHPTGAVEAELVGDDEAGDHRFAKAPARFDQALIRARYRMLSKHDPRNNRVEERLDDHANARPGEQANALAVGDGRVRVRRPPDLADGVRDVGRRMDIEHGKMLPGEACSCAVFDGGRADREWSRQCGDGLRHLFNRLVVSRGDGFDQVARERDAGRDGKTLARDVSRALVKGTTFFTGAP
jgi:hypothetical protein